MYHHSRYRAHTNSLTIEFLCITTQDIEPTPTSLQSYSYVSPLKIQSSHQQSYNRIPMYHHSRYRAHANSLTIVFLCITTQDTELTPTVLQSYSYVSPLKIQSSHQQSYNRIPMYHHSRYWANTNILTIVFLCITTQDTELTPTVLQSYSYVSPLKILSPHQHPYNRIPMYHHSRYWAHTNILTIVFLCITTQDIELTPTVLQFFFMCITTQDTELTPTALQSYSCVSQLKIQGPHQQSYNPTLTYGHSRNRAQPHLARIINYIHCKLWDNGILFDSKTSTVQTLKFGTGHVISSRSS